MLKATLTPSRRLDLYARKGFAVSKDFEIKDSDGLDFDLTGYTFTLKVYKFRNDQEVSSTAMTVVGSVATYEDTINLTSGRYYYTMEVNDGTSTTVWLNGYFNVHTGIFDDFETNDQTLTIDPNGAEITINIYAGGSAGGGGGGTETPASIKTKYESNSNTNAFTDALLTKLNNIESNATADQTGAEIKAAYENEADTNAYTDAEKDKLFNIEPGSQVNPSAATIKTFYESNANTNAYTDAEKTKLAGVETGATADQTGAEIKALYESESNTNAFTDTEKTKLTGVETGATADQTGAEIKALYEAESNTNAFTDAEKTKLAGLEDSLFLGTYVDLSALQSAHPTASEGSYAYVDAGVSSDVALYIWDNDDNDWIESATGTIETPASIKSKYESNADTNAFTDSEKSKLAGVESGATADQTGAEIKALYEAEADTNALTDAILDKINNIESNATADQTGAEIKTLYEAEADTNAFTDAEKAKLASLSPTSGQSEYGQLPRYYDPTATNIFVDPDYVGTEVGTIAQPYTTLAEAEAALEATTGSQHVHVYVKSGAYLPPINIASGRGKSVLERNRISTYGGPNMATLGQFSNARPTWTQVGATAVYTTPNSNISGITYLGTRYKRTTDGVVHTITGSTSNTITCPTFSGYSGLIGCEVDFQTTPYDMRTARITAFNGTDTITIDTTDAGNISFLGGLTMSCKLYGMRSELNANNQWASENVSGDGLIAVYADGGGLDEFATFPMYDESTIKIGVDTNSDSRYWEISNIHFWCNGLDGLEVQGNYSDFWVHDCFIESSMRCGMSHHGTYTGFNNGLVVEDCNFRQFGAQGMIHWRSYNGRFRRLMFSAEVDDWDGSFYGFRKMIDGSGTVNVLGSAINCMHYRDVDGGDPLDDARAQNEYSSIMVFGTYENGININGYANRLRGIYIQGHCQYTTDTAGIYTGGKFTHGTSMDGVTLDGKRGSNGFDYVDQYVSSSGDVHGIYTDFYSNNNQHRNITVVNHERGHGIFRNIAAHYNLYEQLLLVNNREGYLRADVFSGTPSPGEHTTFKHATILSIGREQKAWVWQSTGTSNDPWDDYEPGYHDMNVYLHLGDGASFVPNLNGINSTRAYEGFSFHAMREALGSRMDLESYNESFWDRYPVTDYAEVTSIVDGAATPDFTADSVGVTRGGAVSYDDVEDCYVIPVNSGLSLNLGDVDTTNVLTFLNAYTNYEIQTGQVITWILELEAEQDGMYFDVSVYSGATYEKRYRVDMKRGKHFYIVQHVALSNYTGSWFIQLRPYMSSIEDLEFRVHSLYVYRGTGTAIGYDLNVVRNYAYEDVDYTSEHIGISDVSKLKDFFTKSEQAMEAGMMIPAKTSGIEIPLTNQDGETVRLGLSCRYNRNYPLLQDAIIRSKLYGYDGLRQVKQIIFVESDTKYTALPDSVKELPGYVFLTPE